MRKIFLTLAVIFAAPAPADEVKPSVSYGLFVDTYYAFDANTPPNNERAYTTLPTRHNEFALNLAFIEGKFSSDRLRGRLALQTGTSVYTNYRSEVRPAGNTGVQLADVLQHVQEGVVGYRLADGWWIDAGIFLSHIGSESFISRDNWTYTRSLIADFSPYYQAGVKTTFEPNAQWSFQLHVLNGWQNVIENNSDKSFGTQITYRPTDRFSVTHNSLLGRESEFRIFQDLILKYQVANDWESALTVDFGMQRRPSQGNFATWYGTSFQNRFHLAPAVHLALRIENYSDPQGIIVPTGTPNGFQAVGASVNVDYRLTPELVWRNELRLLRAQDEVFSSNQGFKKDTFLGVTSIALSL